MGDTVEEFTVISPYFTVPNAPGVKIPVYIEHFSGENLEWITDLFLLGMEQLSVSDDEYADLYDWLAENIFNDLPDASYGLEIAYGFGILSSVDASTVYYQDLQEIKTPDIKAYYNG